MRFGTVLTDTRCVLTFLQWAMFWRLALLSPYIALPLHVPYQKKCVS